MACIQYGLKEGDIVTIEQKIGKYENKKVIKIRAIYLGYDNDKKCIIYEYNGLRFKRKRRNIGMVKPVVPVANLM